MINWIILFTAFLIWLEGATKLNKWIYSADMYYKSLVDRMSIIKRIRDKTKFEQLDYIETKDELRNYKGGFWTKLIYHVSTFIFIGALIQHDVSIFIVLLVALSFIFVKSLYGGNKVYTFFEEFYLYHFVIIYMYFYFFMPFSLFGYTLSFLMMLPIFLSIKMLYNNARG